MHFQKEDLESNQYNWDESEHRQVFLGQPSRRLFDRYNGHQVLFLINLYASLSDKFDVEEGKKVEQEILNHLPLDAKSEISVFNWIKESKLSMQ